MCLWLRHISITQGDKGGDDKLKDMLTIFDNETDKGKLYISCASLRKG